MKKILLLIILNFGLNTGVLADNITSWKVDCESGNGVGCSNLGFMYEKGTGVKQSDVKAVDYYQKACELKHGGGF